MSRVTHSEPGLPMPKQQIGMNMNCQKNAKQTKARIQPKRNKPTAESAENSYATRRKK